jgi:hypothetical protein
MSNHVHLVLRTGVRPLSSAMRRLNGGYARAFNLRHGRCGYLFQDRFRSFLVQDDAYLRVLIRYVHQNPVRAGIVESLSALERYPWCGHAELVSGGGSGLIAKSEVLAHFGPTPGEARRALAEWMHAGGSTRDGEYLPEEASRSSVASLDENAARDGRAGWEPSGIPEPTVPEIRANRLRSAGWTLDALISWACARLCADPVAVRGGRRTLCESRARAVIAALATRDLVLPLDRVARATGVTSAGVYRAIERGVRIAEANAIRLDEAGALEKLNYSTPSPSGGRGGMSPSAATRPRRPRGGRRRGGCRS